MNKVILIGNMVKEPEIKQTTNGKTMIRNSIAIRNDFKNADGEYGTEFVNILVWNNQAEYLSKYAHKGTKIAVEGRMQTSSYDADDGTKRYSTEVVCNNVEILQSANQSANNETQSAIEENNEEEYDPFEEFGKSLDENTDLPF